MTIEIKYISNVTWYNVDTYVVRDVDPPFVTRELDYSINSRGVTISLDVHYDYEGNTANDIEKIRINDGDSWFFGVLPKAKEKIKEELTEVAFFNDLELLKSKNISIANLDDLITDTSDLEKYNPDGNGLGYKNTSIMWIIENMFISVDLENPILPASAGLTVGEKIAITSKSSITNILFDELRTDLNMFYSMNQPLAVDPFDLSPLSDEWDVLNYISYFDFISWFCSMLGLVFIGWSDINGTGYRLDLLEERTALAGDTSIASQQITTYQNEGNLSWEIVLNDGASVDDRTPYYSGIPSDIESFWDNKVSGAIAQTW